MPRRQACPAACGVREAETLRVDFVFQQKMEAGAVQKSHVEGMVQSIIMSSQGPAYFTSAHVGVEITWQAFLELLRGFLLTADVPETNGTVLFPNTHLLFLDR